MSGDTSLTGVDTYSRYFGAPMRMPKLALVWPPIIYNALLVNPKYRKVHSEHIYVEMRSQHRVLQSCVENHKPPKY